MTRLHGPDRPNVLADVPNEPPHPPRPPAWLTFSSHGHDDTVGLSHLSKAQETFSQGWFLFLFLGGGSPEAFKAEIYFSKEKFIGRLILAAKKKEKKETKKIPTSRLIIINASDSVLITCKGSPGPV